MNEEKQHIMVINYALGCEISAMCKRLESATDDAEKRLCSRSLKGYDEAKKWFNKEAR